MHGTLVHCGTQERFTLGELVTIGRDPSCTICLDDPLVAAHHAVVARAGEHFEVRDGATHAGTFLGRRRVNRATLRDGDTILVGPVRLRFETPPEIRPVMIANPGALDEAGRMRVLGELARALAAEATPDAMLPHVLVACFALLRAERGIAVVCEAGARTPRAKLARTRTGATVTDGLSTSVLSQLLAADCPAIRLEMVGDQALRSESLRAQGIQSLIAVPIASPETGWLGMLQLSRPDAAVYSQADVDLLAEVARWAAPALHRAASAGDATNRQSLPRLERAVGNLPVGVIVVDEQRSCVVANDWILARAETIGTVARGTALAHIAGLPIDQLVGGRVQTQATVGETAFHLDAHTDETSRETVVVVTDITEVRTRQARAAHHERLALVGQLAGGIAHDFNNLLSVIVSYASMLAESDLAPEHADDVRGIAGAANSASELVRQLLAFSRREQVAPKVIELGAELAKHEPMWRTLLGSKTELAIELPTTPSYVLVDPSQLEQVILNLVVNARDAIEGRGRVAIQIAPRGDREVVLRVTDNGRGIPPEILDRIFDPYFSTKPKSKGTGLGLATVHGIVEQLGGTIAVTSTVGTGTTFDVALPTTDLLPERIVEPRKARGEVLVVDDDDEVRRVTTRMLKIAGYHVTSASCYDEAIARAGEQRFDVLVTDLVMPGLGGREVARAITLAQPHIRVLFMSGYNPGTPVADEHFLAKPFDRAAIVAKLEMLSS